MQEKYRRSMELLEAEVNDDLVALEPTRGSCFGFNTVAKDVWRQLETPRSFDELKHALLEDYDVSEQQCADELRELLDQMTRAKLIEPVTA